MWSTSKIGANTHCWKLLITKNIVGIWQPSFRYIPNKRTIIILLLNERKIIKGIQLALAKTSTRNVIYLGPLLIKMAAEGKVAKNLHPKKQLCHPFQPEVYSQTILLPREVYKDHRPLLQADTFSLN